MGHKRNQTQEHVESRSAGALEAILEGEISESEKAVYRVLWRADRPLTFPEVRDILGTDRGCSTRLRELELRGMVTHGPRRVCTVSSRMCNTWKPTGTGVKPLLKRSQSDAADIPTAHDIKVYVKDITVLMAVAYSKGAKLSPAVLKVSNWLKAGAPGLNHQNGRRAKRESK